MSANGIQSQVGERDFCTANRIQAEELPGDEEVVADSSSDQIVPGVEVDNVVDMLWASAIGHSSEQVGTYLRDRQGATDGKQVQDLTAKRVVVHPSQAFVGNHGAPAMGDDVNVASSGKEWPDNLIEFGQDRFTDIAREHVAGEVIDGESRTSRLLHSQVFVAGPEVGLRSASLVVAIPIQSRM